MKQLIVVMVGAMGLLAAGYFWLWGALTPAVSKKLRPRTVAAEQVETSPPNDYRAYQQASRLERAPLVAAQPAPSASASPEGEEPSPNRELTREEVLTNLEANFETETIDAQWGVPVARDIYAAVQPVLGKNSEIKAVDCRSSMCRVESIQEDDEHIAAFVAKLKRSAITREGFYSQTGTTPDGRKVLTMYLARLGHSLPKG